MEAFFQYFTQEENVIEATPPTHEAIMLQGMQQRRQALVRQSFMTAAKLAVLDFDVKRMSVQWDGPIDKTTPLVQAKSMFLRTNYACPMQRNACCCAVCCRGCQGCRAVR
jgi:hypothetical protein